MRRRRPTGLPVRTLEDYVQALRFHHRRRAGKPVSSDPLAEDFAPAFSLVEPGALVDPTARIHDSVVLAGGAVEAGAVLVRCLICPGAVVRRDRDGGGPVRHRRPDERPARAHRVAHRRRGPSRRRGRRRRPGRRVKQRVPQGAVTRAASSIAVPT